MPNYVPAVKTETKRYRYEIMRAELQGERSSFEPHWRDLSDYLLPRRSRFYTSDQNKGDRRNQKIIDSTGTLALRTLSSGMMAGITSPARPWFRLTVPDPDLAEYGRVKDWLDLVTRRLRGIFGRSNYYNSLPTVYSDMGGFSTAAMLFEEDLTGQVIRTTPFPIGSYYIACDERGVVNTFFRVFNMTVRQIVMKFGEYNEKTGAPNWDKFSQQIKDYWDRGMYETWVEVAHVITPNVEYDPNKFGAKYKRFADCYYETGSMGNSNRNYIKDPATYDKYLRESGHDYFPVLAPRWSVSAGDVYGTDCPGMAALGDIKALQLMQKRKSQAIEKMVSPPMTGPAALRNAKASILPGDMTFVDDTRSGQGFRPAYQVDPRIQELLLDINDHQYRIQRAFYEDLFLMLQNTDRRDITATEIEERHEEKLLAVGPVLEQTNQDLLDPSIDLTFMFASKQGQIPPPPEELLREGGALKVDYISIMHQAQKLAGIGGLERTAQFVLQLSEAFPSVKHKFNAVQAVDEYADATGVSAKVIRSDEEAAALAAEEQKAIAAQQQMEAIEQGAGAAQKLAAADLSGDNALNRVLQQSRAGQLVTQ